jgi:outer membrane protein
MKPFALLSVLLIALCLSGPGLAQTRSTSAFVNTRDVLVRCAPGAKAVNDIQNAFAERRGRLAAQEQDIRRLQEEEKVLGKSGDRTLELQDKIKKYRDAERIYRQELTQEETARLKPVMDIIQAVIAEYAKEKGLASVQDRAVFLYVDPSLDISEDILTRVNQRP